MIIPNIMKLHVYSIPPQGSAFWDPKSEGSALPYFPCTGDFEFSLKTPIGIFPLYVGPVLCCVGTLSFFNAPLCVVHVLWCVETLSFFKPPLCVVHVLWCVETLSFCKVPLCVVHVLMV